MLCERFRLAFKYQLAKLLHVIHRFAPKAGFSPLTPLLSFTEIQTRAQVLPDPVIATDILQSTVLAFASTAEGEELALRGVSHDAEAIIARVQAAFLQASGATSDVVASSSKGPSGEAFHRLCHSARLSAFRRAQTPRDLILEYCAAGQKLNALKSIRFLPPSDPRRGDTSAFAKYPQSQISQFRIAQFCYGSRCSMAAELLAIMPISPEKIAPC